jgi:hypothetical protein
MSNNSSLPIIAVGALGLSSISCVVSSLTGFLVSGDSNVESNNSTSNTNTDTSNTSTDTSNTSTSNTSTSNTSTSNTSTIPHHTSQGTDGWCIGWGSVHQDVPGCGRICSTATHVGSKSDGTWGPWADNTTVASTCVGAKLDEIWEVQDDGSRKLADGYTLTGKPSITDFQTNGAGKVYYLDRHHVNCNNDGLRRFQLKTVNQPGGENNTIAYEFGCLTGLGITETTEKETEADVDGDPPHTVYLDRHTVDCDNKPITQFKLHRKDGDKIQYKYQCGDTTSNSCRDVTTEYNDQGAGNVIYLNRHNVKCDEGEYLSKFRLDADDNDTTGKYRYEYKCCKP